MSVLGYGTDSATPAPAVTSAPTGGVPRALGRGEETATSEERTGPVVDASELPTLPPTLPAPAGRPLGSGYLLLEPVGSGATGRVWRARRRADDTIVAAKVLREEYGGDPDTRLRFLRESAALRAVRHPHLVPVLDLVAEGDTLAIVMDFVDGANLRAELSRGRIGRTHAVAVLAQLADALTAIHRAGIVHRDVKPENVLVTWRGGRPWAQLTDFGLAVVAGGPAVTRASQLVGTPAYVAPEVVAGRPVGPASDVYALGLTGYELLAGRRPFAAEHTAALLRAHLDVEPSRPDGLAEPLWQLIRRCLAKEPAARPTAADLATALHALADPAAALPADAPLPLPPQPTAAWAPEGESTWGSGNAAVSQAGLVSGSPVVAEPGEPEELRTAVATRPAPAAEPAVARRARRWPLIVALVLIAVLGAGAGIWAGHRHQPVTPTQPASTAPPYQLYFLPVTATGTGPGSVKLDFPDASNLPGFDSYVVFRDSTEIAQVSTGVPPYLLPDVDRQTQHCYRVAALVASSQPTPPAPKPACLTA